MLDFGFNRTEITELYETLEMFKSTKPVSVYDLLKTQEQEKNQLICTLTPGFDQILGGS